MRAAAAALLALSISACGHGGEAGPPDAPPWAADAPIDGAIDASIDAPPDTPLPLCLSDDFHPATLAETGLCADAKCTSTLPGVLAYTPRWPLWSDGATKRRWIYLPAGSHIDTTDMNVWHFPQDTKLWKEFTRDGTRVETRMYWKRGATDDDWCQIAYVWNATQDMAVAAPYGQQNANGTQHDVPSRDDCTQCHSRTPGRILGFSALQLDAPAAPGAIDLGYLADHGLLSNPPTRPNNQTPFFPLWPDRTPEVEAAYGYLHANCGHCHNRDSDVFMFTCPRLFRLDVHQMGSVQTTDTYTTTVKQTPSITLAGATYVVAPKDPAHSAVFIRFTIDNPAEHMPPLATEIVDQTGRNAITAWINQLPP